MKTDADSRMERTPNHVENSASGSKYDDGGRTLNHVKNSPSGTADAPRLFKLSLRESESCTTPVAAASTRFPQGIDGPGKIEVRRERLDASAMTDSVAPSEVSRDVIYLCGTTEPAALT